MARILKIITPLAVLIAVVIAVTLVQGNNALEISGRAVAGESINYQTEMVLGAEDAPVTVIEYASMSCGHCALFHRQTFPDLKKHYIDTGKVRFIFREFPINRLALEGAMIARCAGPDRFFGFLKILFAKQEKWTVAESQTELANVVKLGGMKGSTVEQCLNNDELQKSILKTRLEGEQKFNVSSTPTFIVNGEKVAGALSFEEFEKVLQPLLPNS